MMQVCLIKEKSNNMNPNKMEVVQATNRGREQCSTTDNPDTSTSATPDINTDENHWRHLGWEFKCNFNVIRVCSNPNHLSLYVKLNHHLRWLYLLYCSMTLLLNLLNPLFLYTKMCLNLSFITFFVLPILTAFCKCIKYVYNTKALTYKVLCNVFWYHSTLTYP